MCRPAKAAWSSCRVRKSNLQADRIVLRGDDHEFDNTFFVVPPRKQQVKIVYVGSDAADDQQGPQFYLKLATSGDALRQVEIVSPDKEDAAALASQPPPQICVVTRKVTSGFAGAVKTFVERGGTLVVAPQDQEAATVLSSLVDDIEFPASAPPGPIIYCSARSISRILCLCPLPIRAIATSRKSISGSIARWF